MATFCNKCGTEAIDDQSIFCNKCGTKLIRNIPEKKNDICPNCGTKIVGKESVFCARCGSSISPNQPPTDQPLPKPIKPTKTCPHCDAPIFDESGYYCKTCGAYLHESQLSKTAGDEKISENSRLSQVKGKSDYVNPRIPSERSNAYKPNWILILAFGFGLLSILIPPLLLIFVIASAIAVYYDAKAIRAGEQLTEESTMNTHTWSPLSWGLIVLLFWIICLPLYLIKRKGIFFLNHRELSFSNSNERESDFGIRVDERESCSIRSDGNGKRKIDYNQLIKDAVAQLPQEALHVPHIGILEPICPYCQTSLKKMPGSKTICKSCGNPIYVTKRPSDNKKALLTDAQMPLLNKLDGHKYRLAKLSEYVRDFKRDLNSYQDLGLTQWKFLGCQDAGADPIERELDGKIVEMGSEEEREMLKYLCDPRYRFCPLAVINVPKR